MFEEIPLIYMSVKILKFWAFIYDNNWRRYMSLSMAVILIFMQCFYLYKAREGITAVIRNIYMIFLWVNTVMRAILLVLDSEKVETVLSNLAQYFCDLKKSKDPFIQITVQETNNAGKIMTVGNLFLGILTCVGFAVYPLFAYERVLPFGVSIPGIDEYQTPYYEILYIFQMIVTPMGCCMFIPYTSLIVSFIMFGILMCKSLQHRLRTMNSDMPPYQIYAEMVKCIDEQNRIIKYISSINSLISSIFLYEFLGFGMLLCALLFLLIIVKTLAEFVIVCAYITMIFAQILLLYWYANELRVQFSDVALAAYEADWFNFPVPVQKLTILIIMRAQKTVSLMVGNIHPMTLALFQALLNASYKFFTVLNHIYG